MLSLLLLSDSHARLSTGVLLSVLRKQYMFASIVTRDTCPLFTVMRTDLSTYERKYMTFAPSTYLVAVKRAARCQRELDPKRQRYDYRVASFG